MTLTRVLRHTKWRKTRRCFRACPNSTRRLRHEGDHSPRARICSIETIHRVPTCRPMMPRTMPTTTLIREVFRATITSILCAPQPCVHCRVETCITWCSDSPCPTHVKTALLIHLSNPKTIGCLPRRFLLSCCLIRSSMQRRRASTRKRLEPFAWRQTKRCDKKNKKRPFPRISMHNIHRRK